MIGELVKIEAARRELIKRGFHCLAEGKFGLPSYSDVEAWSGSCGVIYLLYDRKNDGWDICRSMDSTNSVENTWKILDELCNLAKL